jgi:hypothetical protein
MVITDQRLSAGAGAIEESEEAHLQELTQYLQHILAWIDLPADSSTTRTAVDNRMLSVGRIDESMTY